MLWILLIVCDFLLSSPTVGHVDSDSEHESFWGIPAEKFERRSGLAHEATILEIIDKLEGVNLAQRTPERVAHRRADLVRRRRVIETNNPSVETLDDGNIAVEFTLRCESGTYVKETVHGDDGRTQPSMASLIKAKCTVEWLDVGDIHAD